MAIVPYWRDNLWCLIVCFWVVLRKDRDLVTDVIEGGNVSFQFGGLRSLKSSLNAIMIERFTSESRAPEANTLISASEWPENITRIRQRAGLEPRTFFRSGRSVSPMMHPAIIMKPRMGHSCPLKRLELWLDGGQIRRRAGSSRLRPLTVEHGNNL
jgi:hypothetical protein